MKKLVLLALLLVSPAPAFAKDKIASLKYVVKTGILSHVLAKEMCTCRFVSGLPLKECLRRAHTGIPSMILNGLVKVKEGNNQIEVFGSGKGDDTPEHKYARAVYRANQPRFGCKLVN